MITIRQLQVLVEVAASGSFRRCGEKLGLSQVSVSEHVRSLEDRLGVPLFIRRPGAPPVLTDMGRIALVRAEQVLGVVSDLIAETSPSAGGRKLRMAIHSFLMGELPPVLEAFRKVHPTITLEVDTGAYRHEGIVDLIRRKAVDLAFFYALPDEAPLGSRHVRDERLAIFVGMDHPLASKTCVPLQELLAEPTVSLSNRLGDIVSDALASIGICEPRVALATEDFGLLVHSVRSGHGYACMFEATTEACRTMGLARVEIDVRMPALQVHLLTRPFLDREETIADLIGRMVDAWALRP